METTTIHQTQVTNRAFTRLVSSCYFCSTNKEEFLMQYIKTYLLLIVLMLSSNIHAASFLGTTGPAVGAENDYMSRESLLNSYLDREAYESIGIIYTISQDITRRTEDGESWVLSLIENATGEVVGAPLKFVARTSEIDNGEVCIFLEWNGVIDPNYSQRQCFSKDGYYEPEKAYIGRNWKMSCENPGAYTVSAEHFLGTDEHKFELSNFVPGKPVISGVKNITPKTNFSQLSWIKSQKYEAGKQNLSIVVLDNQDCKVPLENIEVEFENVIVKYTGGHEHRVPDHPATGKYIETIPAKEASSQSETHIKVKTNSDGYILAIYEAGIYGVDEKITVKAHVPDSSRFVESKDTYSIKVPDLIPMPSDGTYSYTIAGTGGKCDIPHNLAAVGNRNSIYVTPHAFGSVVGLNLLWTEMGNQPLSYNDASLPNGGFFDKGSFTVTEDQQFVKGNYCHKSHRQGTGIDVNRGASGLGHWELNASGNKVFINDDVNIGTIEIPIYRSKLELLTEVAEALGGEEVDEGTIHYQFEL